jgi:signal transduction histidine kinase
LPNLSTELKDVISEISITNQKMNRISDYAINGNFALKSGTIKNDIGDFITQYIEVTKNPKIKITAKCQEDKSYICSFDVSSIGLIIDNVVSNSIKANAQNLSIIISDDNESIVLSFQDDGRGVSNKISNSEILFDLGVTTTSGFGLGLYHIRQVIEEMGGSVSINIDYSSGFELIARLKK